MPAMCTHQKDGPCWAIYNRKQTAMYRLIGKIIALALSSLGLWVAIVSAILLIATANPTYLGAVFYALALTLAAILAAYLLDNGD